jgi:hypothetical protein
VTFTTPTSRPESPNEPVALDDIKGWVDVLRTVRARRAELDEVEAKARAEIEAVLGAAETGTVDGKPVLTWKWGKPPRRFDQTRFKAEHPDLASAYTVLGEPVRRLTLMDPQ